MKKLIIFNLKKVNEYHSYSMERLDQHNLSKHLSVFENTDMLYNLMKVDNTYYLYSYDPSVHDDTMIAKFYFLNKNFLYGEIFPSGKCLYGILGSTMHRNFSSTDLMLIVSDVDFNKLDIIGEYPEYSHDKRGWDKAFMAKLKLTDKEELV